jgi:flavodoxin I
MRIGIYYGSTMGNTQRAALLVGEQLKSLGEVSLHDVAADGIADMASVDLILLGTSTWGVGDLQDDWLPYETLSGMDLTGRKAAVFGTGDQQGYSDTYVDALATLAEALENAGATLIGSWSTEGYDFAESRAVQDGKFVGLALDEDNQSDLTEDRIAQWVAQLKTELGQ